MIGDKLYIANQLGIEGAQLRSILSLEHFINHLGCVLFLLELISINIRWFLHALDLGL